jgi:hypothetical protein
MIIAQVTKRKLPDGVVVARLTLDQFARVRILVRQPWPYRLVA